MTGGGAASGWPVICEFPVGPIRIVVRSVSGCKALEVAALPTPDSRAEQISPAQLCSDSGVDWMRDFIQRATIEFYEGLAGVLRPGWYWVRYPGLHQAWDCPAEWTGTHWVSASFAGLPYSGVSVLANIPKPGLFGAVDESRAEDVVVQMLAGCQLITESLATIRFTDLKPQQGSGTPAELREWIQLPRSSTMKIVSQLAATPCEFQGQKLPFLLKDRQVPVLVVNGIPGAYSLTDDVGTQAARYVVVSLYAIDGAWVGSRHITAYSNGTHTITLATNDAAQFSNIDECMNSIEGDIGMATVAAEMHEMVVVEMSNVVDRIKSMVNVKTGRAGYEAACYLFGVPPESDDEVLGEMPETEGALWKLEYPGWTRQEIYADVIRTERKMALAKENG